jgi:glutamate/tyrosine decarboxylase-like PLP-dependent enzyme
MYLTHRHVTTSTELHALHLAASEARRWLAGYDTRAVGATVDADTLRARMTAPLPRGGIPALRVIEELVAMTEGGLNGSASGRFFAWVIGGVLPSALAADWLTGAWDQNAAIHATAPAAAMIEEMVGAWLLELLDLPRDASFALTTGCQLAHFTGLAAARCAVLRDAGWNVHEDGLAGAPTIRVLTSEHRHASIDRAVRFLGIGTRNIESLVTDAYGRIPPDTLRVALARESGPVIVVLDAADLNIAAIDDFATLIPIAKTAGAWVHIDGAFGLFARASTTRRHLVAGIELADSWATDAHKWLNVPCDSGIAFVRDRDAHHAAMSVSASYITADSTVRSQIDWNPEWSRRARGFTLFAALRELGAEGVSDLVDRSCDHCQTLVRRIGALPGAEVVWVSELNQGLVRFLDPRAGAGTDAHDRRTDAVIASVNATGEAFFSGTTWLGRRAMRISVVNWRTTAADVERTVGAVARVLGVQGL